MALRWIDLLGALTPGSRPPFAAVLRIFFVSSFVSNFVPSVAADMYRAYALRDTTCTSRNRPRRC